MFQPWFFTLIALSPLLALATDVSAEPMTFREATSGGFCAGCTWIAAEGDITAETPNDFRSFFGASPSEQEMPLIVVNSRGGNDLGAALELGRLFRAYGAVVSIGDTQEEDNDGFMVATLEPGQCLSGCAYAFLGGRGRHFDSDQELGFHQFFDAAVLSNADREAFSGIDRFRDQFVAGELISYLIEMDVSTDVFAFASKAPPDKFAFMSQREAQSFRVVDMGSAMKPWEIIPLASGLMIEARSFDDRTGVRFFCLRKDSDRVHVQILNRSPNGTKFLSTEFASGTPEDFFEPAVGALESQFVYPDGRTKSLKLAFNRKLSEPESKFHVNFDFTMSSSDFKSAIGATQLTLEPRTMNVSVTSYWHEFVDRSLPGGMNFNLNRMVLENCV
ncbi:hypothetical protein [Thioclava sp. F36-6]|uniref:COG3904 family protein n=1 Tax=Thioclava sp. F36-6 TaxID=1915316 RepID=UPI0011BAD054|nr:hypothetical protein [Thioclava sp. F36-6]